MTSLLERTSMQRYVESDQPIATSAVPASSLVKEIPVFEDGVRVSEEPVTDANTAPEHFGWSKVDPSVADNFDSLPPEERRRRTSVLGYDSDGNELVDHAAGSYVDHLKEQLSEASSFEEALGIYHRVQNTDPIHALDLLALISQSYKSEIDKDHDAHDKIIEFAEKSAVEAERVVLGETDHATPEEGLRSLVVAADIVSEDPEAEAEIIERLDKVVRITHDSNGILVNGHAAADPMLAEAISKAISDRHHIPSTSSLKLGELVDQHVEIKLMDQHEQDLMQVLAAKQAELDELRNRREEAEVQLKQEVRSQKRPAGIRGLLSGLVKVGR